MLDDVLVWTVVTVDPLLSVVTMVLVFVTTTTLGPVDWVSGTVEVLEVTYVDPLESVVEYTTIEVEGKEVEVLEVTYVDPLASVVEYTTMEVDGKADVVDVTYVDP